MQLIDEFNDLRIIFKLKLKAIEAGTKSP